MNLQSLIGSQAYDDMCEEFAEQQAYGKTGMYPNAITAFTSNPQAVQGLSGLQTGDLVYFSPNEGNGMNGHVGIYQGNNQFVSATDNGVQSNDLNAWQQSTGQQALGYIPVNNSQLNQQLSQLGGNSQSLAQNTQQPDSAQMAQQYQLAQQLGGMFQNYEQQETQNAMGGVPKQSANYIPGPSMQPTGAQQWLSQYIG